MVWVIGICTLFVVWNLLFDYSLGSSYLFFPNQIFSISAVILASSVFDIRFVSSAAVPLAFVGNSLCCWIEILSKNSFTPHTVAPKGRTKY